MKSKIKKTNVAILSIVVLGTWLSTPVWAVRAPEDVPVTLNQKALLTANNTAAAQANALIRDMSDLDMLDVHLDLWLTTKEEIIEALLDTLQKHPDYIGGLDVDQLKLIYASHVDGGGSPELGYVIFIQFQKDLEVEETYVRFTVKLLDRRAEIMSAHAKVYPHLTPAVGGSAQTSTQLKKKAANAIGLDHKKVKIKKKNRKLRFIEGKWRKVTEINFEKSFYKGVVDEATGESWSEDTRIFADVSGKVQGRGILFDPFSPTLDTLKLEDLLVTVLDWDDFTDVNGDYLIPGLAGWDPSAKLKGRWSDVIDIVENLPVSLIQNPVGTIDLMFNPTGNDENATAQVNAYYHTTFIHNFLVPYLSDPSPINDFDEVLGDDPIPTITNIDSSCNAFYTTVTPSINFYTQGTSGSNTCPNTAYDTVVYHEYGHFIDDMYGGITNFGLSEGWGDVIAILSTDQPEAAEGFFGPGTTLRTGDNNYQYIPNDEVHALGQAWAGFGWHFRENLINSAEFAGNEAAAAALTRDLILPTIEANAIDIPNAVFEVIIRDDLVYGNGDLVDGTPHFAEIINAANQHSIPLGAFFPFSSIDEPAKNASFRQKDGPVAIIGTASGGDFNFYELYYGVGRSPATWILIPSPGTTVVNDNVLGMWDIADLLDGLYTIKLEVNWTSGAKFISTREVGLQAVPPIQITFDTGTQSYPAISGDRIVWMDYRNGNYDIYLYDLSQPELGAQQITTDLSGQYAPAIDGTRIVWRDLRNGNYDIYLYDLSQPELGAQQITFEPSAQLGHDIDGTRIVWHSSQNGNKDIYLYDLNQPEKGAQQITFDSFDQSSPAIDGTQIVWRDRRNGNTDIYHYDLSQPEQGIQKITTEDPSDHYEAAISGNTIVWRDWLNDHSEVYLYDLSQPDQGILQITNAPAENRVERNHPSIDGTRIVWEDWRSGRENPNIYLYDITTGQEKQITTYPSKKYSPVIDGARIVWFDDRNGAWDIYLKDLDVDNDGILNNDDNCPNDPNSGQEDIDFNGVGDVCEVCGDGVVHLATEECDGDDFGGTTCSDMNTDFVSGTLNCSNDCLSINTGLCLSRPANITSPVPAVVTGNAPVFTWEVLQGHLTYYIQIFVGTGTYNSTDGGDFIFYGRADGFNAYSTSTYLNNSLTAIKNKPELTQDWPQDGSQVTVRLFTQLTDMTSTFKEFIFISDPPAVASAAASSSLEETEPTSPTKGKKGGGKGGKKK